MEVLKIRIIKEPKVDSYWYSGKVNKCFYANITKWCLNGKDVYQILELSPYVDDLMPNLKIVQIDDAEIIGNYITNIEIKFKFKLNNTCNKLISMQ